MNLNVNTVEKHAGVCIQDVCKHDRRCVSEGRGRMGRKMGENVRDCMMYNPLVRHTKAPFRCLCVAHREMHANEADMWDAKRRKRAEGTSDNLLPCCKVLRVQVFVGVMSRHTECAPLWMHLMTGRPVKATLTD